MRPLQVCEYRRSTGKGLAVRPHIEPPAGFEPAFSVRYVESGVEARDATRASVRERPAKGQVV